MAVHLPRPPRRKFPSTARGASRRLFVEALEDRHLLAAVVTDKLDYRPGDTALITATDFRVGETVQFQVVHTDGTPNTGNGHEPWTITDGAAGDLDGRRDGNVTTPWYVDPDDSLNSAFLLTALGLSSGLLATTTFTDAAPPSPDNLQQWDPGQDWVTGNNDGTYFEGDTVPYYIRFSNLVVGDTYRMTIGWDTTKGGKHALDYLRSYDATISFPPAIDPAVDAGVTTASTDTIAIPPDPNIPAGIQQSGAIKAYNADLTLISGYTLSGTYAGDSTTTIAVTFVAQDDGVGGATTNVVLTWGGHIATRQDWGANNSAVSISGSPYHMRLVKFFDVTNNDDLGGGNQDRSLSADAVIFPAIITIIKDALPDDGQDFSFTTTGAGLANFTLDDDGTSGNPLSNSTQFSITDFGTKTITEAAVAGWSLTNIEITEIGTADSTFNLGTKTATLLVQEGETITVKFTNTKQSSITVVKDAVPNSAQDFSFSGSLGAFSLDDDADPALPGSQTFSNLSPGSYTVTEAALAGWDLTNIVLAGDTDNGSVIDLASRTVTIDLDPGESITATFTNTQRGSITWEKRDHEDALQGGAAFQISPNPFTGSGVLDVTDNLGADADGDDGQFLIQGVLPGTYTITETLSPPGFTIDPDPTRVVMVAAGESASVGVTDQNDPYTGDGNESDFHNVPILGTKSGTKFEDHNGNGIRDIGEQGLEGWTIFVDYNNNGQLDIGEPSAVTNASGDYTIAGINLGTWRIREVLLPGWTATFPAAADAFGRYHEETFTPGSVFTSNDFGNFQNVTISGQKFHDLNGNGSKELGEPGLANWIIELDIGADGSADAATITDTLGNYSFLGLGPGTYRLREVQQAGWIQTTADPADIVAASGTNVAGVDFGNFQPEEREIVVIGPDKSPTAPAPVLVVEKDTGTILASFVAYEPGFLGGTRVATGDLTGDGIDEIITAPGRGRAPEVRVFTQGGVELTAFRTMAYAPSFKGGVQVAVGDVNGDGLNDIVTVPSSGKAQIKVFLNQMPGPDPIANVPFKTFNAFPPTFVGGAFVRVADMGQRLGNGTFVNTLDGKAEVLVGSGPGIKAAVKVFHVNGTPAAVRTVNPFSTGSSIFKNGVNLDVADLNGDAIPDLIVGAENGGNSRVETFLWNGSGALVKTGSFLAYGEGPSKIAPVRVAALDTNGDGTAEEIVAIQGPNGTTGQIRRFEIDNPNPLSVTQSAALGGFPGPYFIAAIDSPVFPELPPEAEGEAAEPLAALPLAAGRSPRGDLNRDGQVTPYDAWLLLNRLDQASSSQPLSSEEIPLYDLSGDGSLSAIDALLLLAELNRAATVAVPACVSPIEERYQKEVDTVFAELGAV